MQLRRLYELNVYNVIADKYVTEQYHLALRIVVFSTLLRDFHNFLNCRHFSRA